jgi:LacI family transcriptional regulator
LGQRRDSIALIGFDDLPLAHQSDPLLTTVSQLMEAIGSHLVGMLLDVIGNGVNPLRRRMFPQEVVIRQSCGALRMERSASSTK